ncbi:tRNA wybutosine-synthesizing protein 3 [Ceratocystis lukuohia]|uniref:tRNA(Phe) 7-[(3-amino-3-carboxypropyl)-4-demethylwyosine(37)-N(4)]-methyltransferase n=1 Tax=Ceratocystis lukuohia TaxID=2019550 RepID=A0ABR4MCP2_9PEZI
MNSLPPPPVSFAAKKAKLLEGLQVPDEEYTDLSPKGSVDIGIRPLIRDINCIDGLVTTSSCAGRVSVFVEGRKKASAQATREADIVTGQWRGEETDTEAARPGAKTLAAVGGKGGGGTWLFVSHDPVHKGNGDWRSILGLQGPQADKARPSSGDERLVHFKFEPMLVLRCALQAGFRESGSLNIMPDAASGAVTPMVAVRSMGLSFESLLGHRRDGGGAEAGETTLYVPEDYLDIIMNLANERFVENARRIERFRNAFLDAFNDVGAAKKKKKGQEGTEWEDVEVRRARKREEGLRKRDEAKKATEVKETVGQSSEVLDLEGGLSML